MKYTIAIFVMACFICSCKNDKSSKTKTEEEIYSGIEKKIDSFVNESIPAFSINRMKKVAKRIEQTSSSEEFVLDTLPDNSNIAFKKINGNLEFYLKDGVSITQLYSVHLKESLRPDAVAIELFDSMKRRKCEHWIKICNNPEFPLSHEDKLLCKLYISFYCN